MKAIEDKVLFNEVSAEESAIVSGGQTFDLDEYLFILGAGVVFGNPGLTAAETQFAWEQSIDRRWWP